MYHEKEWLPEKMKGWHTIYAFSWYLDARFHRFLQDTESAVSQEAYDFVDFLKESGQTYWQILPFW